MAALPVAWWSKVLVGHQRLDDLECHFVFCILHRSQSTAVRSVLASLMKNCSRKAEGFPIQQRSSAGRRRPQPWVRAQPTVKSTTVSGPSAADVSPRTFANSSVQFGLQQTLGIISVTGNIGLSLSIRCALR